MREWGRQGDEGSLCEHRVEEHFYAILLHSIDGSEIARETIDVSDDDDDDNSSKWYIRLCTKKNTFHCGFVVSGLDVM